MSKQLKNPFNIFPLVLTPNFLSILKPVKTLDIFEPSSKNFHTDGLFSTQIFGRVGSQERLQTYAYIDLKVDVLHPLLYRKVCALNSLYRKIMNSEVYVIYNKEINEFEISDFEKGFTGYNYFLTHYNTLSFKETDSIKRDFAILLNKKYRDLRNNKLVVMPATYRDYEVSPDGKPSEDEVNTLYRKIMALSNIIPQGLNDKTISSIDTTRFKIQETFLEIYEYFENISDGKTGFILAKWAARNVQYGTRNVITSDINDEDVLFGPHSVSCKQTVVGLFQYLKSTQPLTIGDVKRRYLNDVFFDANSPSLLVNPKTLKQQQVIVKSNYFDEWTTNEGLERIIEKMSLEDIRHLPVIIDDFYLGLIYKDNNSYMLLRDIDNLPKHLDRNKVTPITYIEFFYVSVAESAKKVPGLSTRYPVANLGGIYPTFCYLKTTVIPEIKTELDAQGNPTNNVLYNFPKANGEIFNSQSISSRHIKRAGADFDGDMMSWNAVMTNESVKEIKEAMRKSNMYVGVDGKMIFSASDDIIDLVFKYITQKPPVENKGV